MVETTDRLAQIFAVVEAHRHAAIQDSEAARSAMEVARAQAAAAAAQLADANVMHRISQQLRERSTGDPEFLRRAVQTLAMENVPTAAEILSELDRVDPWWTQAPTVDT
jgi:hypothetical protein